MSDLISNILRGSISSIMNIILLFTLTKSKFSRKSTIIFAISIFSLHIATTIWFYVHGDLTALSRFNIIIFIVISLALRYLAKLNFMQWSFTFLTAINISMIIIVLSFHLSRFFPLPQYAHTIFRLILYLVVICVFHRYLRPVYQLTVNNWPIFSALVICIFLNLSYFFFFTDDIHNSLIYNKWPLLLLVTLSLVSYGTVFYSLNKMVSLYALETENFKIQHETGRLHQLTMKLERYANYDTLTELPNRRFFFEKLEKVLAKSESISGKAVILYIDLDAFKDINDTYGHKVGDGVLVTIGKRLLTCIQETDFVARLGGDEFAILIENIEDVSSAEDLAKKIGRVLQESMCIDTIVCKISSSIGIAVYPDAGKDSETLLKNADSAMYEVKRGEKGGIRIFKDYSSL
ncbi:MAG: GGDEF domain-containing protein [Sphaerochaetaceae bacterium]